MLTQAIQTPMVYLENTLIFAIVTRLRRKIYRCKCRDMGQNPHIYFSLETKCNIVLRWLTIYSFDFFRYVKIQILLRERPSFLPSITVSICAKYVTNTNYQCMHENLKSIDSNNEVFLRVTNHTGQAKKNLLGPVGIRTRDLRFIRKIHVQVYVWIKEAWNLICCQSTISKLQ